MKYSAWGVASFQGWSFWLFVFHPLRRWKINFLLCLRLFHCSTLISHCPSTSSPGRQRKILVVFHISANHRYVQTCHKTFTSMWGGDGGVTASRDDRQARHHCSSWRDVSSCVIATKPDFTNYTSGKFPCMFWRQSLESHDLSYTHTKYDWTKRNIKLRHILGSQKRTRPTFILATGLQCHSRNAALFFFLFFFYHFSISGVIVLPTGPWLMLI